MELNVDNYADAMLRGGDAATSQLLLGQRGASTYADPPKPLAWPETVSDAWPYTLREADIVVPPLREETPLSLRTIARPSVTDRYPIQIGSGITSNYLSATYRMAVQGWRYQFVDLLNELLDYDPHTRAVARQRVLATAGGRFEVRPARLPANDSQTELAKAISDAFEADLENIPARTQSIGQLNWGVFYGLGGAETEWERQDHWVPVGLSNIHSRRLNYPNPSDWELRIYDQGFVGPGSFMGPTTGYGLRISQLPGKFIVHAPALNGDYATRDGEGRYVGMYMLMKRMVVRATTEDFERTIRPWVIGYYNRDLKTVGGEKPIALDEDRAALKNVLASIGAGSLNYGTLPDSVRVELLKAASTYSVSEFLSFLNREISKALLGQSFTTEPGANGNLTTAEIAKAGTMEILRYDARALSDTLERDLARPWMKLNYPGVSLRLCPRISIAVDELPSPKDVAEVAYKLTQCGAPVDIDELGEKTNQKMVDPDDEDARGTWLASPRPDAPLSPEEQAEADALAAEAAAKVAGTSNGTSNGKSNGTTPPNQMNGKSTTGKTGEPTEDN